MLDLFTFWSKLFGEAERQLGPGNTRKLRWALFLPLSFLSGFVAWALLILACILVAKFFGPSVDLGIFAFILVGPFAAGAAAAAAAAAIAPSFSRRVFGVSTTGVLLIAAAVVARAAASKSGDVLVTVAVGAGCVLLGFAVVGLFRSQTDDGSC